MKASDLGSARVLEDLKLMVCQDHDVFELHNFTVETDMRTGETVIILVPEAEPTSTSARDFEPHPGFPEFNEWLYEEFK